MESISIYSSKENYFSSTKDNSLDLSKKHFSWDFPATSTQSDYSLIDSISCSDRSSAIHPDCLDLFFECILPLIIELEKGVVIQLPQENRSNSTFNSHAKIDTSTAKRFAQKQFRLDLPLEQMLQLFKRTHEKLSLERKIEGAIGEFRTHQVFVGSPKEKQLKVTEHLDKRFLKIYAEQKKAMGEKDSSKVKEVIQKWNNLHSDAEKAFNAFDDSTGDFSSSQLEFLNRKFDLGLDLPNPEKIPELMKELVEMLNHAADQEKAGGKIDYLRLAANFHQKFVRDIHPFTDGNGRMARLFTRLILEKGGLGTFIVPDQSKYQEAVQKGTFYEYLKNQLERKSKKVI